MPRKTPAQKAANSTAHFKQRIADAYATGEIDAPLTRAMQWLYAALAQRARENQAEAPELYKHATDSISAFAEQLQHWMITESESGIASGGG